MRKFSDFATEERPLEGNKVRLDELLDTELIVIGHRIRDSKYRDDGSQRYMTLQVQIAGETAVCFTGSEVLINQIERYRDQIPFVTTIRKIDRYYTFS